MFGFSLHGNLKRIVQGTGTATGAYHLWYMYMLIGLYASVPFLARMLKAMSERDVFYLIILSFVLVVIPGTLASDKLGFSYFQSYSFIVQAWLLYAVLGYWLHKYSGLKNIRLDLRCCLLLLVIIILLCIKYHKLRYAANWSILTSISDYRSLWTFLCSVLAFSIIRDWFADGRELNRILSMIAVSAFSIYLWHLIALDTISLIYPHISSNPFLSALLYEIAGLGAGVCVYLALRNTKLSWLVK